MLKVLLLLFTKQQSSPGGFTGILVSNKVENNFELFLREENPDCSIIKAGEGN